MKTAVPRREGVSNSPMTRVTMPLCAAMILGVWALITTLFVPQSHAQSTDDPPPSSAGGLRGSHLTEGLLFPGGITPVGPALPSDEETLALAEALLHGQPGQSGDLLEQLESFITARPGSAYVPALSVDLGYWYRKNGRFSKSLEHWSAVWQTCAGYAQGEGKRLADHALVQSAFLMASLGRVEDLDALIKEHRFRVMAEPHLAQIWRRTIEAVYNMRRYPGRSFKCGVYALNNVARRLYGRNFGDVANAPSPDTGFSLAHLTLISEQAGLQLVPAVRPEGTHVAVPSVVHWKQNHYGAIVDERDGMFLIEDPTFLSSTWIDAETLEAEASGYFLIPTSVGLPPGWRTPQPAETLEVFGKGYPQLMEDNDGPVCNPGDCCEPGSGGSGTGSGEEECGMPTWRVLEPNINLEVTDIPLLYKAAYGPDFVLNLGWRQRNSIASPWNFSHLVDGWQCDLLSHIDGYPAANAGLGAATFKLQFGNGFQYNVSFADQSTVSDQNYLLGFWAVRTVSGSSVTAITVYFRNGSIDQYSRVGVSDYNYRLTSRKDATGQSLTYTYDAPGGGSATRLTRVTAADGAQFNFGYADVSDVYRITSVSGPNGRSASFGYTDVNGTVVLSGVTDAAGMSSTFTYDPVSWWITQLVTPYGTNSFTHYDMGWCDNVHDLSCPGVDRSVTINEPGGSRQVYLFYDNPYRYFGATSEMLGRIPTAFASSQIPQYAVNDPQVQTLDLIRDERNTHYWGRQQAAALSTTVLTNLTAADYRLSRTRHWLRDSVTGGMRTLGWVLPPSQDGSNEVQPTFYDYAGKDSNWGPDYTATAGTNNLPAVISQRMPDGTTKYTSCERNALGLKTREIDRWVHNGTTTFRTNSFRYATGTGSAAVDNQLLVEHKGPYGEVIFGRALHSTYSDQIGRETNAVGEVTTFNYDASRRLTTRTTHAGLLSTYTYDATSKRLLSVVDSVAGVPVRTNSFTWLNGYLRTQTDPRGFTRTFDFDFLGRPTQITYPDTTTETFGYSLPASTGFNASGTALAILDLVTYKDRLGNYSRTLPDRLRRVERIIEPSKTAPGSFGTEHTTTYCGCGSPASVTRGASTSAPETTTLTYNYQGALTRVALPNSTTFTNTYDLLGRLRTHEDALMKVTNTFDNLGRLIARRNGAGLVEGFGYDLRDRVLSATNANGVVLTNQWDGLSRRVARGYPTGARETWQYTLGYLSATAYTNQISDVTTWVYDASQRRLKEIGVGIYTNTFTWAPADDLRTLADGKNQVTAWSYDAQGRVTSKTNQANVRVLNYAYNPLGQITNRWSAAKGNTVYSYDRVGNLTLVNYPSSPDLTFQYNALSRLTNMVDAVGTTRFTYNTIGDLLTEDAPWANDVATYSYDTGVPRLLTGVSLQQPSGAWSETNRYDAASRLSTVATPAGTFTYTYSTGVGAAATAATLWKKLAQFNGTSTYITNSFDSSGRLTETSLRNSNHIVLNRHAYTYNNANRRTQQTFPDAGTATYTYDGIGQLKVANSSVNAEDRGYLYDAAWNLNTRTNSGVTTAFGVNAKNELASAGASSCSYDNNGNYTGDGVRVFAYDDENQLASVNLVTNFISFYYDGLGRLRRKLDYTWSGSAWVFQQETRYIYHGRRVIQERNGTDVPQVAYTRGWDVSGSFQGAGGIGGLLARSHGYSAGAWSTHHAYHADGVGNITAMVGTGQTLSANYEYDPFGNLVSSSGGMAGANLYRFSSKEFVSQPGLYYYGFRFYHPHFQRWINQDPLGESGGINLYRFVGNAPTHGVDPYGLWGVQVGGVFIGSGAPSYVFDSQVWSETKEGYHTGLDAIGTLEPTPIADVLNAGLYGLEGDWGNAGISACGMLPYAGDGAKLLRLGRKLPTAAKSGKYVEDFPTKATKNWSGAFKSEGEARALARTKLGSNPVEVAPGKWRSGDGKWQYRSKPGDVADRHIHLEELNPQTGEVIQNLHLRWPEGCGR